MSLNSMEKALCNKMPSDYWKLVAPVKAAKALIKQKINELDSALRSIQFSPASLLESTLDDMKDSINGILPDPSQIDSLFDFMKNCPYLSDKAPVGTLKGLMDGIKDNMFGFIDDALAICPEINGANLASQVSDFLNNLGFPGGDALQDLLKQASAALECLDALCELAFDPDLQDAWQAAADDLDSLIEDLGLVGDPLSEDFGSFDLEGICAKVGMSPSQIAVITDTTNVINQQKENALTAVNDSITAAKDFVKPLGGFFK